MVVNVAQRGGMRVMLTGQPSWRLRGPGESVQRAV
jgi:hypothetical protein